MFASQSASAQLRTSYFMEGSYFRTELNPALAPTRGYLALPGVSGVGVNLTSNFLSLNNLFVEKNGGLTSVFNSNVSDSALKALPENPYLKLNSTVNVFGLGFYGGKSFWNIGVNARVLGEANFSSNFFNELKKPTGAALTGSNIDMTSYLEAYIGSSLRFHRTFSLGFRLKALFGVAQLNGDIQKVMRNNTRTTLSGKYSARGMFVSDNMKSKGKPFNFNTDYMLDGKPNAGFAADLGAEIRLWKDHIKLSAAVTDLGFIDWTGERYMNNVNLNTQFNLPAGNVNDMFKFGKIGFEATGGNTVRKAERQDLNYTVNAGLEFNMFRNFLALGVLARNVFESNDLLYTEFTASVNLRPTHWLSATVSKTMYIGDQFDDDIFGIALNFHPRLFNVFVGADFASASMARTSNGAVLFRTPTSRSIYAGVSFSFKRPKYVRVAQKEERAARREARELKKQN